MKPNLSVSDQVIDYSIWCGFKGQFKAELLMRWRNKSDVIQPLIFFVLVLSLFPIAINGSSNELSILAPGILWVIVLLASLFSAENLFREDYNDGSLVANILSAQPMFVYVLAKLCVHFLFVAIPLAIASPILALMLYLPSNGLYALILSILLGGLSLSFIAAFGAALTVSTSQRSMLLALISLPLYIPVLIFATASVRYSIEIDFPKMQLLILLAFALLSSVLLPWSIAAALKINVEHQ